MAGDSPKRSALEIALKLLAARPRTRAEVEDALTRRGHEAGERADALVELERFGYLDDARFARDRALSLLREGGRAERAVLDKLLGHGVPAELAHVALAEAREQLSFDPERAARALLERRGLLGAADRKLAARGARLLAARGFSPEVIEAVLPFAVLDPPEEGG